MRFLLFFYEWMIYKDILIQDSFQQQQHLKNNKQKPTHKQMSQLSQQQPSHHTHPQSSLSPPKSQYTTKFHQALQLAQSGNSQQSLKLFQQILSKQPKQSYDYCTLINYGVLSLQQGRVQQAKSAFLRGVKVDIYQYIGYYNLFIVGCHLLQSEKIEAKSDYLNLYRNQVVIQRAKEVLRYLYMTLSCLYAELGDIQKDPRLCTKALVYCQENSMAYMNRASIYERDGKLKLSENDYSSALYYAPEDPIFYMKRAQFYWKNGRITESNEDLKNYWALKNKYNMGIAHNYRELKCKDITYQEAALFQNTIAEKSVQLEELLGRLSRLANKRQIGNNSDKNWQVNIPTSPKNANLSTNPKISPPNTNTKVNINQTLKAHTLPTKQPPETQNPNKQPHNTQTSKQQTQKSDEPYIDESSKNISQQIEKLQKQIRMQRGKLSQSQSQSLSKSELQFQIQQIQYPKEQGKQQGRQSQKKYRQSFNFQNILNSQIQKKVQEIQKIKRIEPDILSNGRSNRISEGSVGSRNSQRIITNQQIINYTKIQIEIVSAQFFDSSNKQQSKIYISYGNQKQQTQYSKTNLWRQKYQFVIQHNLHRNIQSALNSSGEIQNQDININISEKKLNGEILLQLEMKSKSIWSAKKIIGRGTVNIQQMGNNKCILSNEKEKTGIVYFKLKLF